MSVLEIDGSIFTGFQQGDCCKKIGSFPKNQSVLPRIRQRMCKILETRFIMSFIEQLT